MTTVIDDPSTMLDPTPVPDLVGQALGELEEAEAAAGALADERRE